MFRSLLVSSLLVTLAFGQCPGGSAGTSPVNGFCPTGLTLTNGVCCSTSSCQDKVNPSTGKSDCHKMASYCTDSTYQSLMMDQCKKTCGFCSSQCVDKINPSTGTSDCPSRAYLCNNSAYRTLMTTECPKTCGFCR